MQHTLIAYTSDDRFVARSISERATKIELETTHWLDEMDALGYILISLNYNPSQKELPPPVGRNSSQSLTITASTPEMIHHASFEISPCGQTKTMKLQPIELRLPSISFARYNFFDAEETTETTFEPKRERLLFEEPELVSV